MSNCGEQWLSGKQRLVQTCQSLEVSFAKQSLLLRCLSGHDDLVNYTPVLQGVHQTLGLSHHQLGCRRSSERKTRMTIF